MSDDQPMTSDKRMIAILLAAVAAVCLIFSTFSKRWLENSGRYQEVGMGLRESFACLQLGEDTKPECETRSNATIVDEMKRRDPKFGSSTFVPLGWATTVLNLLAALSLLAAVGIALARKQPDLPVAPTTLALLCGMITLITGCVFIATKPGPAGMVGTGMSFWIFGAGCVMGILGAQLLAKVIRPADKPWEP